MSKSKGKEKKGDRLVWVPAASDMDDETLLRHLEKRHSHETGVPHHGRENVIEAWIGPYRAFHERIHSLNQHDHEHLEER